MPETMRISIGQLAQWPLPDDDGHERLHLDLGPHHPSRTGILLADAIVNDAVVQSVRVQPGFNHRSAEKLFEVRDYRQILVLADRHDWQAPFTGELAVALACEHLMGLTPPPRATWLRMVLAEQARIASHLAHLGWVAHRLADVQLAQSNRALRERGRQLLLAVSGNRVHPMANRLGGLAFDVEAGHLTEFLHWALDCAGLAAQFSDALHNSGLGMDVGLLDAQQVRQFGIGGPAAIAAGLSIDLRTTAEYLCYAEVADEFAAPAKNAKPDAHHRLQVLSQQVRQSARIIARCVDELSAVAGPVDTKLSKIVKIPDSEGYLAIEGPWGPAGVLLVSRADRTPWRLKLRTASFANVQALEVALQGCPVDRIDEVVASLGWTAGDLDK